MTTVCPPTPSALKALGDRTRRHHGEADGDRRRPVPGRAGRREAHRPPDHRHVQLPVRAKHQKIKELFSPARSVTSRRGILWYLDTRHGPTTSGAGTPARQGRIALGAQGHPPLRPSTCGWARSRRSCRPPRACATTASRGPTGHELPALPAQGGVPLLLGHQQEPETSSTSTSGPRRPTATCATGASSARTWTSRHDDAVVRYANGVNMSYSLNNIHAPRGLPTSPSPARRDASMVRDYERQPWTPGRRPRSPHPQLRTPGEGGRAAVGGRPRWRRRQSCATHLRNASVRSTCGCPTRGRARCRA